MALIKSKLMERFEIGAVFNVTIADGIRFFLHVGDTVDQTGIRRFENLLQAGGMTAL